MERKSGRIYYIDWIRCVAVIGVIILHVSAENMNVPSVETFDWQVMNFLDSITRWCVPALVMISGALLIDRPYSSSILMKRIKRLIIAFFFWSIIYIFFSMPGDILELLLSIFEGHYHMWFIPMIIGCYLIIPIIKGLSKEKKLLEYYIVLAVVMFIIWPTIVLFSKDFLPSRISEFIDVFDSFIKYVRISTLGSYATYFALGYYLASNDFCNEKIIYIVGILGFIITVGLSSYLSIEEGGLISRYYDYFTLNVFFESIGVFYFFKKHMDKDNRIIRYLAKYSFAIYMVHALVIEQLKRYCGFDSVFCISIVSIPLVVLLALIVSIGIARLVVQIPYIGKYLS